MEKVAKKSLCRVLTLECCVDNNDTIQMTYKQGERIDIEIEYVDATRKSVTLNRDEQLKWFKALADELGYEVTG